jgi:hypothetical protein
MVTREAVPNLCNERELACVIVIPDCQIVEVVLPGAVTANYYSWPLFTRNLTQAPLRSPVSRCAFESLRPYSGDEILGLGLSEALSWGLPEWREFATKAAESEGGPARGCH